MKPLSVGIRTLLAAALLAAAVTATAEPVPLDRIVAVVNEDVVLASDLQRETRTVMAQLRQRGTQLPSRDVLERQVLERLIMQRLQLAEARRLGIRVDDASLNAAVQRIADQNRLSLSEFRATLEQEGYSYPQFREGLREEITLARLRQRQAESQVTVTPQEIDELLATQQQSGQGAEYLLGHILIATPEAASPEQIQAARAEAEQVREQLQGGADFAELAAAHSDSATGLDGGSLGWRSLQQLPTLFTDQVPRLRAGQVGELVQSPSGFHIIKLLDQRSGEREMVTQTHARHILIQTNEVVTDEDARLRLQSLRERILQGEDFGELARAHSDDRGSAAQGGDLGWASPGKFVPSFEEAIARLQPGELGAPFQSPFGWHLVQVLERRQHDSTDELRRARAAATIRERKAEDVLETWLRRLRDEAYVDIRLES